MWRWLDLNAMDPIDTQAVYDAVAIARGKNVVSDTLIFCYPRSPLVCVGYHQQIEKELDVSEWVPVTEHNILNNFVYSSRHHSNMIRDFVENARNLFQKRGERIGKTRVGPREYFHEFHMV